MANECGLVSALSAGYFHSPDFSPLFNNYSGSHSYLTVSYVLQNWVASLFQSRYCVLIRLQVRSTGLSGSAQERLRISELEDPG